MWDFADVYKKDQFAVSYLTLHEWNYKKLKKKTLRGFMEQYGYHTIAMYSLGTLGNLFLEEAVKENLQIAYIIDKNSTGFPAKVHGIPVIGLSEVPLQKPVDVVVICHVYYYNQIADDLIGLGLREEQLLSLNDIVFTL